jgi:hypothetical protein
MSFVIIWDTCTKPEYYKDLHDVLAAPEEMIIRYDYSSKYFDSKSRYLFQQLKEKKIKKIDVLHCYGEQKGFSKNTPAPNSNDEVDVFIPFRLSEVISCDEIENEDDPTDSKMVYDCKLKKYPDPKVLENLKWKLDQIFTGNIPFKYFHTYVETPGMLNDFTPSDIKKSNNNWYKIVTKLLDTQFREDTFWRIEFSSLKIKGEIPKFEKFDKDLNITNNALSLKDDEDVFFKIIYKNSSHGEKKKRLLNVNSTDNIVCNRSSVKFRPYSVIDFHFRGSTSQYLKSELASIDLFTEEESDDDDNYPIGPNLRIHVKITKSKTKLFWGTVIGALSLATFTISAKLPLVDKAKDIDLCSVFFAGSLLIASSIGVLWSGFLLRKEFKLK